MAAGVGTPRRVNRNPFCCRESWADRVARGIRRNPQSSVLNKPPCIRKVLSNTRNLKILVHALSCVFMRRDIGGARYMRGTPSISPRDLPASVENSWDLIRRSADMLPLSAEILDKALEAGRLPL
jgi:hypothetical protein